MKNEAVSEVGVGGAGLHIRSIGRSKMVSMRGACELMPAFSAALQ